MKAVIQKLELKRMINRYYLKIELLDENGVKHCLANPFLSGDINFRKQVFGILSACNNFDLMKLATDNPIPKRMIGYFQNGLQILENEDEEWFNLDKEIGLYRCKKPNRKTRNIFDMIIENNMLNVEKKEGVIEMVISQSGTFQLLFTSAITSTFFVTNQIYYGFGYPLNIGTNATPSDVAYSAKAFTSFIVSIMKLYGINDLLKFGGNTEKLPLVEIKLNADNIIATITNPTTGMGLAIGSEYEIVNVLKPKEKMRKRLCE